MFFQTCAAARQRTQDFKFTLPLVSSFGLVVMLLEDIDSVLYGELATHADVFALSVCRLR